MIFISLVYVIWMLVVLKFIFKTTPCEDVDMSSCIGSTDVHKGGFRVEYDKKDYFKFFKRLGKTSRVGTDFISLVRVDRIVNENLYVFLSDFRVRECLRGYKLGTIFIGLYLPFFVLWLKATHKKVKLFALVMGEQKAIGYLSPLKQFTSITPITFFVTPLKVFTDVYPLLKLSYPRFSRISFVSSKETGKTLMFGDGKNAPIYHVTYNVQGTNVGSLAPDTRVMFLLFEGEIISSSKFMYEIKLPGKIVHYGFNFDISYLKTLSSMDL